MKKLLLLLLSFFIVGLSVNSIVEARGGRGGGGSRSSSSRSSSFSKPSMSYSKPSAIQPSINTRTPSQIKPTTNTATPLSKKPYTTTVNKTYVTKNYSSDNGGGFSSFTNGMILGNMFSRNSQPVNNYYSDGGKYYTTDGVSIPEEQVPQEVREQLVTQEKEMGKWFWYIAIIKLLLITTLGYFAYKYFREENIFVGVLLSGAVLFIFFM